MSCSILELLCHQDLPHGTELQEVCAWQGEKQPTFDKHTTATTGPVTWGAASRAVLEGNEAKP